MAEGQRLKAVDTLRGFQGKETAQGVLFLKPTRSV